MNIEYRKESEPEASERSRGRFAEEIQRLRALGFFELCHYTEALPRFSFIYLFLIFVLAKANREVIRVESPLRLVMTQPLLANREQGTYALVFGIGVKFYTLFTDGTGLISANFASKPIQDMRLHLYKYANPRSLETCWQDHQREMEHLQQTGKIVDERIQFENYLLLSQREDLTQ